MHYREELWGAVPSSLVVVLVLGDKADARRSSATEPDAASQGSTKAASSCDDVGWDGVEDRFHQHSELAVGAADGPVAMAREVAAVGGTGASGSCLLLWWVLHLMSSFLWQQACEVYALKRMPRVCPHGSSLSPGSPATERASCVSAKHNNSRRHRCHLVK